MVVGDIAAGLVLSCRVVLAGHTLNMMGAGSPSLLEAKAPGFEKKKGNGEKRQLSVLGAAGCTGEVSGHPWGKQR